MIPIQWQTLVSNMRITAQPVGVWTPVIEYLPPGMIVRIFAWGTWSYSEQTTQCGPDGHRTSFISPKHCLTKDAPVGALVCKIGGGTADLRGTIFPGGSQSTFTVPEPAGGLFMTINDEMAGFDDNSGDMTVSVAVRLAGGQSDNAAP
jgi:hypothetical protein